MKNIHVLPTDKPSRLYLNTQEYIFENEYSLSTDECQNKHIYITSDEEIKEGDWIYYKHFGEDIVCKYDTMNGQNTNVNEHRPYYRKIILTTDLELIKDGVQPIDDEFLEWFVQNPSVDEVEFEKAEHGMYKDNVYYKLSNKIFYKIIITKEEQKQQIIDMMKSDEELGLYDEPKTKCYCGHTTYCDCGPEQHVDLINSNIDEFDKALKLSKQETLEEAAIDNYKELYEGEPLTQDVPIDAFINGYKLAQERSYSEEEVLNKLTHFAVEIQRQNKQGIVPLRIKEWFDRNKKK